MATSNFGGGRYQIDVDAAVQSQDYNNNTSTIYARIIVRRISGSGYSTGDPQPWNFYVNGVHIASGSWTYNFTNYAGHDHWIWQGTWVHYHNADGTATPQGYTGWAQMDSGLGGGSAGGTITPATIPRASTPTLSRNPFDAASSVRVYTNRKSSSFDHVLQYAFGNIGFTNIAGGLIDYHDWTPPIELLQQIPNSTQGNGTLRLHTFNSGNGVGAKDVGFTLTAPPNAVPTLSSASVTDIGATNVAGTTQSVSSLIGAYVQSKSQLKVDVTASGFQGSTITSRRFTLDGRTTDTGGSLPVTGSGSRTISYTATDSRGRTSTASQTITVLPYALPATTAFKVRRANTSAGNLNEEGTYLRVDMTASVQSLIVSGTQKNSLSIRAYTRPRGATAWTARNVINHGSLTYDSFFVISGGAIFPVDQSFEVMVELIDKLDKTSNVADIATSAVYMHWGASGIGFGKYWERGAGDFNGPVYGTDTFYAPGNVMRGTTAQRDAYFGEPSTDVQRVQLANLQAQWYNTDLGWIESFYMTTGTAGLTAPGLVASSLVPAGWYPVDTGPYGLSEPTVQRGTNTGTYIAGWDSGRIKGRGGEPWFQFLPSGLVRVNKAGVYDVRVWTTQQQGTGTTNYHLRAVSTNGSTVDDQIDGNAYSLFGSLYSHVEVNWYARRAGAGTHFGLFTHAGTLQIHMASSATTTGAQFLVRYVGPPLHTA